MKKKLCYMYYYMYWVDMVYVYLLNGNLVLIEKLFLWLKFLGYELLNIWGNYSFKKNLVV